MTIYQSRLFWITLPIAVVAAVLGLAGYVDAIGLTAGGIERDRAAFTYLGSWVCIFVTTIIVNSQTPWSRNASGVGGPYKVVTVVLTAGIGLFTVVFFAEIQSGYLTGTIGALLISVTALAQIGTLILHILWPRLALRFAWMANFV